MGGVVTISEDRVVNPIYFGFWIDDRFAQGVGNEDLTQSFLLTHADAAAAKLTHFGDVLGPIPPKKRRIAPAADDVQVDSHRTLKNRRLDVDRCRNINAMVAHCHR